MTLPEQYAHDYRDMAMSEDELRKMLEGFAEEIRKERVTHCDDINCPECNKVAYEAGAKSERERVMEWANKNTEWYYKGMMRAKVSCEYNECLEDLTKFLSDNH